METNIRVGSTVIVNSEDEDFYQYIYIESEDILDAVLMNLDRVELVS